MNVSATWIDEMMLRRRGLIIHSKDKKDEAHAISEEIVRRLVEVLQVSDPELHGLLVLDNQGFDWSTISPAITVARLDDLVNGSALPHRHHCVVAVGNGFLSKAGILRRVIPRATRFYSVIQHSPRNDLYRKIVDPQKEVIL